MTKTLTEQWREGTLPDAEYYVKNKGNVVVVDYYCELTKSFAAVFPCNVKEVLAPVPSYNEFLVLSDFKKIEKDAIDNLVKIHTEKLEKKLAIAIKALNGIRDIWANNPSKFSYIARIANRKAKIALEEMEGVKWR